MVKENHGTGFPIHPEERLQVRNPKAKDRLL